ncbi:hypothetical protein ENBRE01_1970 [Enteropsectra breve]|nr:hypothetical protein ENBRE01_1970 [Enteropsectra breve]
MPNHPLVRDMFKENKTLFSSPIMKEKNLQESNKGRSVKDPNVDKQAGSERCIAGSFPKCFSVKAFNRIKSEIDMDVFLAFNECPVVGKTKALKDIEQEYKCINDQLYERAKRNRDKIFESDNERIDLFPFYKMALESKDNLPENINVKIKKSIKMVSYSYALTMLFQNYFYLINLHDKIELEYEKFIERYEMTIHTVFASMKKQRCKRMLSEIALDSEMKAFFMTIYKIWYDTYQDIEREILIKNCPKE